MTEKELNIALREMARSVGLCDKWYNEWKDDSTIDECLERFINGFDFAVKNDWPPLDFIRKNFRMEDLHRHNVYIDEEVNIEKGGSGYYVLLGKCTGTIKLTGFAVATVHLRHESKVSVKALDDSIVFVRCWDNSDAVCEKDYYGSIRKIVKKGKEGV